MKLPSFSRLVRRGQGPPAQPDSPRSIDVKAEASKLHWYHCIRLAPGYTTPGIVGWSSGLARVGREVPVSLGPGAERQVLAGHRHHERVLRL